MILLQGYSERVQRFYGSCGIHQEQGGRIPKEEGVGESSGWKGQRGIGQDQGTLCTTDFLLE